MGFFLQILAAAAYVSSFACSAVAFATLKKDWELGAQRLLWVACAVHTLALGAFAIAWHGLPLFGVRDFLSFTAWFLVVVLLVLERMSGDRSFRLFNLCVIALMQMLSVLLPHYREIDAIQLGFLVTAHIALLVAAYACFIFSCSAALMFLFLYAEIKQKRIGFFYQRFSSLERLERTNSTFAVVGVLLLLLGTGMGVLGLSTQSGLAFGDAKTVGTLVVCCGYGLLLGSKMLKLATGRRFAWAAMAAFGLVVANFSLGLFFEISHRF